ncbi:chaplin family protein [Rhizohabitans arisaemae]|uniref:chaplin family protein n=1 Tax=Rhizohabitans arisaemae TaxID=2720610 RepID=UPI0024B15AF4|nr:chaplin family protein [Rhizohabitans arisaemae]
MRTWAKGTGAPAALLAASVVALGAAPAYADTSGNNSIGGGNQLNLPISIPLDLSGNAIGVAGDSAASSTGGATVRNSGGGGIPGETSGRNSVLGGNQVNAPISLPVNACGNAIAIFGESSAGCKGGSSVRSGGGGGAGGNFTTGESGILAGNQILAPISAPVNACGNAIAIFGESSSHCRGGSEVRNTGGGPGGNETTGRSGVAGGNQVVAPISAPLGICGNTAAVAGEAFSGCRGGATVKNTGGTPTYQRTPARAAVPGPGAGGNATEGRSAAAGGNQVVAPVGLPINVCGNGVGNAPGPITCPGGATAENGPGAGAGGNTTTGRYGAISGNQVVAPVTAPANICGNAAALLGEAFAECKGGAEVKNGGGGAGGNTTTGKSGVISGNQVIAPITAPVNACGNAVAALGLADAHCKGGSKVTTGPGGGWNTTSGQSGVAAGNQVIAPITAPVNACGNAVGALGDAGAGCLGGALVGKPDTPLAQAARWAKEFHRTGNPSTGVLPALPLVPATGGLATLKGVASQPMRAGALPEVPVIGGAGGMLGLPELPVVPGMSGAQEAPGTQSARQGAQELRPTPRRGGGLPALAPVQQAAGSLPVSGAVRNAATTLPVGNLGLMSAEQPAGAAGMGLGSLIALALGSALALTASLINGSRRFRFGRR